MNTLFGIQLATGLDCIVAWQKRNGMEKGGLEQEIGRKVKFSQATIQKWQKDRIPDDPKYVEYLIIRCKKEGHLGREWAEDLLHAYNEHHDPIGFLDEVYGPTDAEFTKLSNMARYSEQFKTVKFSASRGLTDLPKDKLEPEYLKGTGIQIEIDVAQEANLLLLDKDSSGTILCLSPSQFVPESQLKQGENILPQEESGRSAFYIDSKVGREQLIAIVTEEPLPDIGWKIENPAVTALELKDRELKPIVEWVRSLPNNRRRIFETSFQVVRDD